MKELNCGACRRCCQWQGEMGLRPRLTQDEGARLDAETILLTEDDLAEDIYEFILKAQDDGSCIYLGDEGCTIYDKRPAVCKDFDCRILYQEMDDSAFINVLIKGKELLEDRVRWANPNE